MSKRHHPSDDTSADAYQKLKDSGLPSEQACAATKTKSMKPGELEKELKKERKADPTSKTLPAGIGESCTLSSVRKPGAPRMV